MVLNRLLPMRGHTPDLFNHEQDAGRERLHHAVDTLNQTFGNGTVFYGGAFGVTVNAPMRIAFTRIPTPELEEIDSQRERRLRPKMGMRRPRRVNAGGVPPLRVCCRTRRLNDRTATRASRLQFGPLKTKTRMVSITIINPTLSVSTLSVSPRI